MPQVFQHANLGPLELKNRLIHSATFECMADENGAVTDHLVKRYVNLAKGEVGLIIPGYMYVHPRGKAFSGQTGIHDDRLIPGLTRLVNAVHEAGGLIAFQLAHGGRQCPKKVTGKAPLAPSGFGRDPASMNKPAAAAEADIQEVIASFAKAAKRAFDAGADAIQLHCAHGYLLSEFLSPFFNRRHDQWGGSPENNFRLLRQIILAIQESAGKDRMVMVKMNTDDYTPKKGITPDLAAQYAAWLADLGVAALEVSSGTYYSFHTVRGDVPVDDLARALPWWMRPMAKVIFKKQVFPCRFQKLYHLPAAEKIKPVIGDMPLILVGGVRTLGEMEKVLSESKADFLSMSRPFIREPFLAKRMNQGKTKEASCISCNKCFAAVFNGLPLRCYTDGLP
jgi:2,4-dienoyl-CoA reductase-like NADH-dependent reductase (Old Yellow Enzyme family)